MTTWRFEPPMNRKLPTSFQIWMGPSLSKSTRRSQPLCWYQILAGDTTGRSPRVRRAKNYLRLYPRDEPAVRAILGALAFVALAYFETSNLMPKEYQHSDSARSL